MSDNNHQIKSTQTPGAFLIFIMLWVLAIVAMLFVSFFYAITLSESTVRLPLIVLIIVAIPFQFVLLKNALIIFFNHEDERTDGAALARSLFMIVGSILLSVVLALAYLNIVCG